ncbi:MAG: hypothetical protein ACRENG_07820, partial [bacterium]
MLGLEVFGFELLVLDVIFAEGLAKAGLDAKQAKHERDTYPRCGEEHFFHDAVSGNMAAGLSQTST